jgi:hypothetical protein
MGFPSDPNNPYASPFGGQSPAPPAQARLPTFAKTMFIIDLVFCGLRALMVPFSVIGYTTFTQNHDPLLPTAVPEVLASSMMVIFGISTNVVGLLHKPWTVWLGSVSSLATLGSLGVAVWQGSIQMAAFAPGTPQRIGGYIGLGVVLLIRIGILALYVAALVQFAQWVNRRPRQAPLSAPLV